MRAGGIIGALGCAAALIFSTSFARADEISNVALLKCAPEKNKFVIRFGLSVNDEPVKSEDLVATDGDVTASWSLADGAPVSACVLANGQNVVVATDWGQAFPYGAGGADPDTFMSVTIDGRHVYYKRKFYAGYGVAQYEVGGVLYRDGKLSECSVRTGEPGEAAPKCVDVSARLNDLGLPLDEVDELAKDKKREEIAAAGSPRCDALRAQADNLSKERSEVGRFQGYDFSEYAIDINNDGKTDQVLRVGSSPDDCAGCGTHYFDGSFLVAFSEDSRKPADFVAAIKAGKFDVEAFSGVTALPEWDGVFISLGLTGSSSRYVYNVPFKSEGSIYVHAFEANMAAIPAAVISKLGPDNKVELLCKFSSSQ